MFFAYFIAFSFVVLFRLFSCMSYCCCEHTRSPIHYKNCIFLSLISPSSLVVIYCLSKSSTTSILSPHILHLFKPCDQKKCDIIIIIIIISKTSCYVLVFLGQKLQYYSYYCFAGKLLLSQLVHEQYVSLHFKVKEDRE